MRVKNFKDGSNNWWVGFLHMTVKDKEIITLAGGIETEEHKGIFTKYLKRKKLL